MIIYDVNGREFTESSLLQFEEGGALIIGRIDEVFESLDIVLVRDDRGEYYELDIIDGDIDAKIIRYLH